MILFSPKNLHLVIESVEGFIWFFGGFGYLIGQHNESFFSGCKVYCSKN